MQNENALMKKETFDLQEVQEHVNYKTLRLEITEMTAPYINTTYVMHFTPATVKLDCGGEGALSGKCIFG